MTRRTSDLRRAVRGQPSTRSRAHFHSFYTKMQNTNSIRLFLARKKVGVGICRCLLPSYTVTRSDFEKYPIKDAWLFFCSFFIYMAGLTPPKTIRIQLSCIGEHATRTSVVRLSPLMQLHGRRNGSEGSQVPLCN